MNTQQLKCFVCVAEHLNFTKAANELYLAVPTVTHHIQSLEEELDSKLFERTSRMVRMTEAGKAFYPDAVEIIDRMTLAQKHVYKADADRLIFFRIGCLTWSEIPRLRAPITALKEKFPQVRPRVVVDSYSRLKRFFDDGQVDILVATREVANQIRGVTFQKVETYDTYALLPESYPQEHKEKFSINTERNDCLITIHPKFMPFQANDRLQKDLILYQQSKPGFSCGDDQEAILLAQAGYGIAILPGFSLPEHLNNVRILPVAGSHVLDYGFAYDKRPAYAKFFMEEYTRSRQKGE